LRKEEHELNPNSVFENTDSINDVSGKIEVLENHYFSIRIDLFNYKNMIMKKIRIFVSFFVVMFCTQTAFVQPFLTPNYEINRIDDVEYGRGINFSGREQPLLLNIAYPINDTVPECGRPLMIIVHGGAFITGSKQDGSVNFWMEDFAKKGYVAASIEYRLGMFHPKFFNGCNLANYECGSMADTSEWHRALHRGIQDVRGAIRYLITQKETYQINPDNVFMIGESAGGFIVMGVAYDDEGDPVDPSVLAVAPVARPHKQYDNACRARYSYPIDSMLLERPDLGSAFGILNPEGQDYKVRGVASIYGGIMKDMFFDQGDVELPALYVYAQPNDLIVPFNKGYILGGYSSCAVNSAGCPWAYGDPYAFGNFGVVKMLDAKKQQGLTVPEYKAEFTDNHADCLTQVLFPQTTGHAIDNFTFRTKNITEFFYTKLNTECANSNVLKWSEKSYLAIPNPAINTITVKTKDNAGLNIIVKDQLGTIRMKAQSFPVGIETLLPGIYYISFYENNLIHVVKFSKI